MKYILNPILRLLKYFTAIIIIITSCLICLLFDNIIRIIIIIIELFWNFKLKEKKCLELKYSIIENLLYKEEYKYKAKYSYLVKEKFTKTYIKEFFN